MSRITCAFVAALLLTSAGRVAQAAPTEAELEEAKRHYARGVELYKQGVDEGALAELERAYALSPNYRVLYNVGLVELDLKDLAGALRAFTRFLAEGGDDIAPARRTEVAARIAKLGEQVGALAIAASVDGAELTLDDMAIGTAPLAGPVKVNPGHHRVSASAAGHEPESKLVSVAGGDEVEVRLVLRAIAAPAVTTTSVVAPAEPPEAPRTPAAPEAPAPGRGPSTGAWIGMASTGALGAGAAATGIAALVADSDLSHAKSDGPKSAAELDHLATRARALAIACDVLTAGALVAGGVTLYLTLRAPRRTTRGGGAELLVGASSVWVRGTF